MSINSGFQQQQPLGWSAAVRSAPSQRPGARMIPSKSPAAEEKSFAPKLER
jgi:hypothetical protein